MVEDFDNVINPQGNLVALKRQDVDNAVTNLGYKLPQNVPATPLGGGVTQPEPLKVPEFVVPDDPSFIKTINKATGKTVLLKKDDLDKVTTDQYDLYSKENEARVQRVQSKLSSLADSPWYITGAPKLSEEHAKDDIMTDDGKFKLVAPDGKPLDLDAKSAIEALKNPTIKFRDPHAQELYEAQLLFKSTQASRVTGAAKELNPFISEEDTKELNKPVFRDEKSDLFKSQFADDKLGLIAERVLGDTKFRNERLLTNIIGQIGMIAATKGEGLYGEMGAAERAGASITAKYGTGVLPTLARGATEGVIISSPHALAQAAIDKDLKGAAETLALGAGLGGVLNLGVKGLSTIGRGMLEGRLTKAADEMGVKVLDKEIAGSPQQQESFLKLLGEKGLAKEGNASKTVSVLESLAKGEALEGIATKLSASAEKIPASAIQSKVEEIGNATIPLNRVEGAGVDVTRPPVDAINQEIAKLADKQGNLSLSNLVKIARDAGEKMSSKEAGLFYQKVNDDVLSEAVKLGNVASEKAGAKLAAEWAQASFNQKIASSLPKTIAEFEAMTAPQTGAKKSNKIIEMIANAIKGKAVHGAAHLASSAVGGTVGHAIGGPIGLAAGLGAGALVGKGVTKAGDAVVDKLFGSYLENPKNASQLTGWLAKQSNNEHLASYMVLDSKAAYAKKMEDIAPTLQRGAVKVATQANPIKELLGSDANGLSKDKQFAKLSQQVSNLVGNPEVKDAHLKEVTAGLAAHPQLQEAMVQDMDNKIQYIYSILPKNPNAPQPFTKQADWKPTPTQLHDFESQLSVAQDPFILIDNMKNGTITPQQVATASALNPAILAQMRNELMNQAYSGKVDLTYRQKLSASILMGENIAVELNKIPQLQSVYAPQQPQGQPSGGGGSNIKAESQSQPTTAQRISNK